MRYLYTQQKGQPAKDTSVRGLAGVRKPARTRAAFLRALRSATCVAALFLVAGAAALAQSRTVTGKVGAQDDGSGIPGVNVLVKGTTTGAITDANGSYSVSVPGDDATLVFSFIGYITQEVPVGSRSTVDVQMAADVKALEEVVVTGYTTQQKKDITSAVAVVSPKELLAVAATSVQQQLQGRAAGVFVTSSNVPGQGANVRIRGFGTIGNNDPLYIIDGVPTKDNLANINQNDIESIQILKDATSASIYGARAGNGVIIITTKRGKAGAPKVTFDAYYGTQTQGNLLPLLNTAEYGQYLWQSKLNAGVVSKTTGFPEHGQYGNGPEPVIPDYIYPNGAFEGDPRVDPSRYGYARFLPDGSNNPAFGRDVYQITRANKEGTNWIDEVLNPAPLQNYQLGVSGGGEAARYAFSANYFNQQGLIIHNGFERYSVRANTDFTIKKRIRIGENIQILYARRKGIFGDQNESNEVSFALRNQPIVPVKDIAGNWAGTLGNNLGNARNPVALLYRSKDNGYQDVRIFGNVYTEADILNGLTARTSFGVDGTVGRGKRAITPDWENSEAGRYYEFTADFNYRTAWTWTNTLNYKLMLNESHDINVTAGTEAIRRYGENQSGFRSRYATTAPLFPENLKFLDAGNPQFQTNSGSIRNDFDNSLFSYFGQLNYSYRSKYLLSATLRRDASSRFLAASRWATFPAVSVGWRLTEEEFMKGIPLLSDLKLRAGWGQTGNQDGINDYNSFEFYNTDVYRGGYSVRGQANNYDLAYSLRKFGNPQGKWETTTSTNVGFDLGLMDQKVEVNFDWYNRQTDDVLLQVALPLALGNGDIPFYNAAGVRNRGVDLGINYRDKVANAIDLSLGVVFSTYKNVVTVIDPNNDAAVIQGISLRTPPVTRSVKGYPISSYYGYIVDGIIQDPVDESGVVNGAKLPGYYDAVVNVDMDGDGVREPVRGVGKFIYRDVNGDGVIGAADQTLIGSPHPDFNFGVNLSVGYKGLNLTAFLQGVYGNQIFNYVRYWTDFNTFQGNRSTRMLYDSWRPDNRDAKLPILDERDAISSRPSTYFLEDGSYARLKNLQLSYDIPPAIMSKIGMGTFRVYVQAQNLFTLTKYTGLDPEMQLRDNNNNQIGVDEAVTPTSKMYLVGLSLGF